MEFVHKSVLFDEAIESLNIDKSKIILDGTAGGGGHSREIAKRAGRLIAVDQDPDAIKVLHERLDSFDNVTIVQNNFSNVKDILKEQGIEKIDGMLLDLGVSSFQLDTAQRGFSYHADAPLDMRMSSEGMSAKDLVNTWSYEDLRRILYDYGEEKFAPAIAKAIVAAREIKPIETTGELAELVKSSVPQRVRREKNPCKKTFQAVRIAVNDEMGQLDRALDEAFDLLAPGGRLAIITFHSLEDRMVKRRFAEFCKGCTLSLIHI